MKILLLLIFTIFSFGCSNIVRLSDFGSKNIGINYWEIEAKKRFKNPLIVACHGSEFSEIDLLNSNWYTDPDPPLKSSLVKDLAEKIKKENPNRDIVLIICNYHNHEINIDRVWYAKSPIWLIPDDFYKGGKRETQRNFDSAGSIWEFVSTKTPETKKE